MSVIKRNNVQILGQGQPAIVLAHEYGCDQNMLRISAPSCIDEHREVLFCHVVARNSDLSAYSRSKYATLDE